MQKWTFLLVALAGWLALRLGAAPNEFKAGVAVIDITPPKGWRMSGYFYERLSTNTHDPLQAKAVVLQQGRDRAALVFCDLIGIDGEVSARARQRASQRTGIPLGSILIAATHSHTGPLYYGALRKYLHDDAVQREGRDIYEGVDYPAILAERLADVIFNANRNVQPALLQAGKTRQEGLSFNRRYHMKDGTVQFNPGKTNANIVRAAGPIDPEVGVIFLVRETDHRPLATLVSFPLHADTVGGQEFSADYPFYIERTLRKALAPDFVSLFGNGTCGDINHINVNDPRPQKGFEEGERIGVALGQTVLASLKSLTAEKPSLGIRSMRVTVPLQRATPEQVAQARDKMPLVGKKKLKFLEEVEVCRIIDLQLRGQTVLPLEVQAFRLGPDTGVVGLPGEIFVELGLAIKQASPFKNTLVIELCNDCIAYVPTKKAFTEGSYEIVNSRVQPGGGEKLVGTAIDLLKQLKFR